MAYNPIAPTSSRENRKRPANVPQGGNLVQLADGGWALDDAENADGYLVLLEDGGFGVDDTTATARAVRVGTDVLGIEVT